VIERPAHQAATAEAPIVFVVDDDESMREALRSLFRSVSLRVETFGSAADLLRSKLPDVASCLVLDVRLPGLSGLDFQAELAKANIHIPVIFMTGHGDIPMSVQAMKAGAVDFLTKPFRDQDMLDAVAAAIERDRSRRKDEQRLSDMRARFDGLTEREREVMGLVTAGLMNHGLFADGSCWSKVIARLQQKGVNCTSVQNPLTSLREASEAARRAIAAQPGPTVLVGHSFSGMIVTDVGVDPKVTALVYVAARRPGALHGQANGCEDDRDRGEPPSADLTSRCDHEPDPGSTSRLSPSVRTQLGAD
jgi:FixJ family two-component response regulator